MKQTHHIGYVQTPSVKNLSNVKNALVENGLVPLTTPNEMLPDAIEKGLKKLEIHDYGMIYEGKYRIRYFDIDGKILKIEYVAEGGKLTPPAKTPNYDPDYLIFDEWNYDIENYVVEQPTDVGAIYKTVDDATYMFCRFTDLTGLNPTLSASGFTSIDWGDGTIDTTNSHTYEKEGNYVIKISGAFTTSSYPILKLSSGNHSYPLNKLYLGKTIETIATFAFRSCRSLEIVSLPSTLKAIGQGGFDGCYSIKHITIPKNIEANGYNSSSFNNSYTINSISLPMTASKLSLGGYFLAYSSLSELIIPKNIKTLNEYTTAQMISLKKVVIGKDVTDIRKNCFKSCRVLNDVFIFCNTVPNMVDTSVFDTGVTNYENPKSRIFWVNDDIIEDLKVATNWSTYASYMKPLSWYPSLTDPNAE